MTTKADYQNLIDEANDIAENYKRKLDVCLKNGKLFNIFNVIGKSNDEVNIHSKFLATLLNPKGEHGCGTAFLECFFEILKKSKVIKNDDISGLNFSSAKVYAEHVIGPICDDGTRGGRIDILITFEKKFAIIIENKIYAGDQDKQLLRYYNYAKDLQYSDFKILYLTPDGHSPEEKSTGIDIEKDGRDKVYWLEISYESEIKAFLQAWLKSQNNKNKIWIYPVIEQYVKLIDEITWNYNDDNDESKDICKLLLKDNNLLLAEEMGNSILSVKKKIFCKFRDELTKLAKDNYKLTTETEGYPGDDSRFFRCHMKKRNWIYRLSFELDFNSFGCIFGITLIDNIDKSITDGRKRKKIEKELRKLQTYKNRDWWWMIWDYLEGDYANWEAKTFVKVKNEPEELLRILGEKLNAYVPVLDELAKTL